MTFEFFIRHLGFLKHVPFLPWIADSLMLLWSSVFNPAILQTISQIEDEVGSWEGVNVTIHKYGGLQFNVGSKEIGHVHGNGVLDLLLDRQTMLYLVNHRLAHEHHTFRNSGWVTYYIRSEGDYAPAIRLIKTGYKWRKNKERKIRTFELEPALIRQKPLPTTI